MVIFLVKNLEKFYNWYLYVMILQNYIPIVLNVEKKDNLNMLFSQNEKVIVMIKF